MLQAGAEDYITKPINEELFVKRMENYFKLIEYKKAKEAMEKPVNLFSDSVYSRKLGFMIDSEASLAEFWEYYLIKNHNASEALCDAVRAIYNIGLYLLPDNPSFKIVAEEDDESLFFSVVELKGFNEAKVSEILYRESSKCDIAVSEQNEISVKLPNYKVEAAPKKETMKIDGEKERILRMSHSDKIGAKSYIAELGPDIIDKLEKLEINEDKLDEAVYEYETDGNYICIARISSEFEVYASVLDTLYEFKNIAYALATLSCFMNGLMPDQIDEKKSKKLGVLLRNMVSDLMSWRKTIFVDRDTGDIHYLDSSLLSSCMQIELIFKDAEPEDDGLELF
jgi:two-component system chemotaxis response regulator CheY